MVLRKATKEDFDVFKILYLDEGEGRGYHWIYFPNGNTDMEDDSQVKMTAEEYFGKDFLDMLNEELHSYSLKDFEKESDEGQIWIAENVESEIIGYIRMFPCGNGTHKISEWAMLNPDDETAKLQMLQELLKIKIPRLRKFSICVTNHHAKELLKANGFIQSGLTGFLSYEVSKKKKAE